MSEVSKSPKWSSKAYNDNYDRIFRKTCCNETQHFFDTLKTNCKCQCGKVRVSDIFPWINNDTELGD